MTARAWTRGFEAAAGLGYFALGVAGFVLHATGTEWLFGTGILVDLVRTLLGGLGVLGLFTAGRRPRPSHAYSWVLFVVLTALTVFGVLTVALGEPRDTPLGVNWADNTLHGLTALVALVTGIVATRAAERVRG
ncbi:MAG: hypothetical protein QOI78_537 [Actinomycetota bacterium]|jgi:hypothetical protein|nr:hypothetical protein [Actinomycetota bacterium]